MITLRPGKPQDAAEGYRRRVAHIESSARIDDVWFMTPADRRPLADDWLVPIGIALGMACEEDVHVAGRVSETLLASVDELQRIIVARSDFTRVGVTADEAAPASRPDEPRTLACLSGGVDAFYTALEPDLGIEEFLYVHGFEANVDNERLLAGLLPGIRSAAAELGKPLWLAETNWRSVIFPNIKNLENPAFFALMPSLFSIAYLMGSHVGRLVVPQTTDPTYAREHPLSIASYVRLWGTEGLAIEEHGHVSRLEKLRRLAESDVAMRHLRVCWDQRGVTYNCGHCPKCLRTRVHLALLGAEGRCRTLPPRLRLGELRLAYQESREHLVFMDENIAEAEALGLRDLAEALRAQRARVHESPTWVRDPRAKLARLLRRMPRSYRKRRGDAALHRLKQNAPGEHVFNIL